MVNLALVHDLHPLVVLPPFPAQSSPSYTMPPVRGQHLREDQIQAMRRLKRELHGPTTIRTIARTFNVSRWTVARHTGAVDQHLSTVQRRHPVNTPALLSEADQKRFSDLMNDYGPVANGQLPAIILEHFQVPVSVPTAMRYLQKSGLRHYATPKGPSIKERDKPSRVTAARKLLRNLKHCLFVDESTIGHFHQTDPKYWGRQAGRYYRPHFPSTVRSNCVGALTFTRPLPLQFPSSTINGERFAAILEHILAELTAAERQGLHVVMDNAGIHQVEAVQDVLDTYNVRRLVLPPYSPDLNPIEHMWSWLKNRIYSAHTEEEIATINMLDHLAGDTWSELRPSGIMDDFQKTLKAIVASGGEYTGG